MPAGHHVKRLARVLFISLAAALLGPWTALADEVTYLPGAAETAGLAGARFSSTLTLFNPGAAGATVRIGMIPFAGKTRPPEVTRSIGAGETLRIPSVLSTLFGLSGDSGTLVASATSPLVYSLSTQNVADPSGAYGLAILPVPEASLLAAGETGHAVWVSQSADPATGFRTNVAVTLVDPDSSVDVRVYDAVGALAGRTSVSSAAPSAWQGRLADLIGSGALPVGRVEFSVLSGRATAYTVLNDNVTSDAIASQVEKAGTGSADRLLDGVAKTPGLGGAYWSTDVRLFNPGASALDVTIDALGFKASAGTVVETVGPRGLVEVSKILDRFGLPDGVAGALRFRAAGPVLIGARTLNSDPTGLRAGTFSSQQFVLDLPSGLLDAGSKGYFVGIDQSFSVPGVRTNLALFGGPSGAAGRLVLRDPSGTQQATAAFSRGPFEWGQLNVADWFPSAASLRSSDGTAVEAIAANSRIDVEVQTGSVDGYVSRIDNGSGDPITVPVSREPSACGVVAFSVDPFTVAPRPLAVNQQGTLAWDFKRAGAPVSVTAQEISIDGGAGVSLGSSVRAYAVQFPAAGTHTAVLTGHDGCRTATRSLEIAVCQALAITPSALPDAAVGSPYSIRLGADGTEPYAWTRTGALPDGLTFDETTGLLAGTPTQPGTFALTFSVVDAKGCTGTRSLSLTVNCGVMHILPTSVPNGTAGTPYAPVTFQHTGGSGGSSWNVAGGSLPPGLTLSTSGVLSGTPTAPGTYSFAVRAVFANGCDSTASLTMTICNPISIAPASLPGATATVAYSQPLAQSGGTGATGFALAAGTLPAGVTLSAAGLLSGTPTVVGAFPITVTVTDSLGCSGSQAYTLNVTCPTITVSPAALPNATAASAYSQTFTAAGGVGTRTFAVTAGALPAGLTFSTAGVLSGTPTVTGPFTFTVTATDANGCTGSQALALTVLCQTIGVLPASLSAGTAGVAYGPVTFAQTNGIGTITWSLTGALPTGVTFTTATATLGGTPTQTGSFPVTVRATDQNGCFTDQPLTLVVNCPTIGVLPASLSAGTAGVAYGPVTFNQTNGIGTITWSLTGALPTGVTFTAATATLGGTPTQTGSFPVTVRATDQNGCFTDRPLTLVVNCPTIGVLPASLSAGTAGVVYGPVTFAQTNGVGTITWSLTGALPTGVTFTTATATLGGTPTQTGSFPVTVRATDQNGCFADLPLTLVVNCPPIVVGPASLPAATSGSSYGPVTFTQTGGVGGVTFSYTGTLPTGMTLVAGVLAGNPSQTGTFPITVTATDSNGCLGTRDYIVVVQCVGQALTVTPNQLPSVVAGASFPPTQFQASGGTGPYTFTLAGAPAGMTFSVDTLSGTPTAPGVFPITVAAKDASGCAGSRDYLLVVTCSGVTLVVSPASIPSALLGSAIVPVTFGATGGTGPYLFAQAGVLPVGLTFAGGVLSGTPTQTGLFPIMVAVTDTATGCTGVASYTVTVNDPPQITSANSKIFPPGVFTSFTVATTGFPTGASMVISETGALPSGLSFVDNSDGTATISGTAVGSGDYPITITASNGVPPNAVQNFTIHLNAPPAITSANAATFKVGTAGTFTVTTTGFPSGASMVISETGGLPSGVTFVNNSDGTATLAGTPGAATGGTYSITITANNGVAPNATQSFTLTVQQAPAITSANAVAFKVGTAGTFTVTTTGFPSGASMAISETGALPSGVSLVNNNDGTATLAGTPAAGTGGTYSITITANNGVTPNATQSFTLTVQQAPAITSANAATFKVGTAGTFTVTTTGFPSGASMVISETGGLPSGVSFTDNGDGTATLAGTPAAATGGTYPLSITANNGVTPNGTQSFTLSVQQAPVITSASAVTFKVGTAGTFTVTTTGFPSGASMLISETGALPSGVTLVNNNDGTATLAGTPAAGTGGTYSITITANNGVTPNATQGFTLTVQQAPAITSANAVTFKVGTAGTFTVTTTGFPSGASMAISETGALPSGVTLVNNNDGTATLAGTPAAGTGGTYSITITANNGVTPNATQSFTLTVQQAPAITSANTVTFAPGKSGQTFNVTTTGFPSGASMLISETGALPTGVTFTNNNNGTATFAGTPAALTQNSSPYPLTIAASNGVSPDASQPFTFNVVCPAINVTGTIPTLTYNTAMATATFGQTGGNGTISWSAAGLPAGVSINSSNGQVTGTPTVTGLFSVVVTATDAGGCTGSSTAASLAVAPKLVGDSYAVVGNTQLVAASHSAPTTPYTTAVSGVLVNDSADVTITVTAGTFATATLGGSITIDTLGRFTYTPPAGVSGAASDSFVYTGTANGVSATATITFNISNMVWYVNASFGGTSDGRSNAPFKTVNAAQTPSGVGHTIYVHQSGTSFPAADGIVLKQNQTLWGSGTAYTLGALTIGATAKPSLKGTVTIGGTGVTISSLDIASTTSTGLTNNGSGTGTATIQNNVTVTTTTGTAISLSNLNTSTLTFLSVSASGAANGISLTNVNTTSGSFSVTGNSGGLCGGSASGSLPVASDCTGGVIQNVTGADGTTGGIGIYLNNTRNVSLTRMEFHDFGNYAIRGFSVDGFTLDHSWIHGTNGNSAAQNEGSISFGANTGEPTPFGTFTGPANGLTGSAAVTSTTIEGAYEDNFRLTNQSGTLSRLTFSDVTIGANDPNFGNHGILIEGESAATIRVTVQNSALSRARGTLFYFALNGNNTADLIFQNNALSNPAPYNANSGSNGLTLISGNNVGSGAITTFSITSNTFRDANGHAVLLVKSTDPGTLTGTFSNNTIGVAGVSDSGSAAGDGVKIQNAGLGTVNVTVTNNTIRWYNNFGIEMLTGGGASATGGALQTTITGNTVANPGTGGLPMNGIHLNGGTNVGDTFAICTNIGGAGALANVITGSGANGGTDFRLRQRQSTTVNLPGYGGSATNTATVVTFVQGNNGGASGLASVNSPPGGGFTGSGSTCP